MPYVALTEAYVDLIGSDKITVTFQVQGDAGARAVVTTDATQPSATTADYFVFSKNEGILSLTLTDLLAAGVRIWMRAHSGPKSGVMVGATT